MANGIGRIIKAYGDRAKGAADDFKKPESKKSSSAKRLRDATRLNAEAAKAEVSQNASTTAKLPMASAQIAIQAARRSSGQAVDKVSQLRSELGRVEVAIKDLMHELETVRKAEQQEKERVQNAEEETSQMMKNLQKAADALNELRRSLEF